MTRPSFPTGALSLIFSGAIDWSLVWGRLFPPDLTWSFPFPDSTAPSRAIFMIGRVSSQISKSYPQLPSESRISFPWGLVSTSTMPFSILTSPSWLLAFQKQLVVTALTQPWGLEEGWEFSTRPSNGFKLEPPMSHDPIFSPFIGIWISSIQDWTNPRKRP